MVIDTGNYYPRERDGRIDEIEAGMQESRWVETRLGRPVVKAFNTMNYKHLLELGRPAGTPGRLALPVAGDDPRAKQVVLWLIEQLGFDGVDDGGLDDSWHWPKRETSVHRSGGQQGIVQAASPNVPERWAIPRVRNGPAVVTFCVWFRSGASGRRGLVSNPARKR